MYTNFRMGGTLLKTTLAVSSGDGRINSDKNGELCYSGRTEFYPFGDFTNSGDYIESDQERELKPKLAVAGAYSYNSANARTLGQLGEYLYNNEHTNITYYGGDLIFKYKGFSLETELYNRNSSKGIITNKKDTTQKNYVISGSGFLVQTGIFISKTKELALRYARIDPSDKISSALPVQEEYVFGFSKYFSKHSLKIQTDCSYLKNGNKETVVYRLSGVVTF